MTYCGVQRPSFIEKLIFNISEKLCCFKATVIAAAVLAMFTICFLAFVSLISGYLSVVEIYRTTVDLVFDCVVWSAKTFGDCVDRPLVLIEAHFNYVSFFRRQMLIFLVFCVTIGIVHSDDSFRIGECKLNSTTESSLWTIYFIVATSFYNAPKLLLLKSQTEYLKKA